MLALKRDENGEIIFSDPKWVYGGKINCTVEAENGLVLPFTASADDDTEHGVELFNLISEHHADSIAPYTEEERFHDHAFEAVEMRNSLLEESDWVVGSDFVMENQSEWTTYRQALRDLTEQEGYPYDISWPVKPEETALTSKASAIETLEAENTELKNRLAAIEAALGL